jgi:hypothetical protein
VVSAHFLDKIRKESISVTKFREKFLKGLLNNKDVENTTERRI